MRSLLASSLLFAACQASPEAVGPEEPTVLIPASEPTAAVGGVVEAPPPPPKGAAIRSKSVAFPEGRLTLRVVDTPHDVHAWDEGGVLWQSVLVDDEHLLDVQVRVGRGESLDGFVRDHHDEMLSDVEEVTVCGREAARLTARRPERHITCIEYSDGRPSSPGFLPARTTVVVAFEHRGLGVTAAWAVPTAMRRQYRELEETFFASIVCD